MDASSLSNKQYSTNDQNYNMYDLNLNNQILTGVNFTNANLTNAILTGITINNLDLN